MGGGWTGVLVLLPECMYLEGIAGYAAAIHAHWFALRISIRPGTTVGGRAYHGGGRSHTRYCC